MIDKGNNGPPWDFPLDKPSNLQNITIQHIPNQVHLRVILSLYQASTRRALENLAF